MLVPLTDGRTVELPDNMSQEDMNAALQAIPPQQNQPKNSPTSSGWDALQVFNHAFDRLAEGGLQLIAPERFQSAIDTVAQQKEKAYNESYNRLAANRPYSTAALDLASNIAAGVAFGGAAKTGLKLATGAFPSMIPGKVTQVLDEVASRPWAQGALSGATGGAGYGMLDYSENAAQRATKTLLGGVTGGVLGGVIGEAGQLLNLKQQAKKNLSNNIANDLQNVADDLTPEQQQQYILNSLDAKTAAVKDAGVQLTPGQAVQGRTFAQEVALVASPEEQRAANTLAKKQQEVGLNKLNTFIEGLSPKDIKAQKTQLYEQMKQQTVPEEVTAKLLQNPKIAQEMSTLNSGGAKSEIVNLPNNSLAKLNAVKENLDDRIKYGKLEAMGTNEQQALIEAKNSITGTLDPLFPELYPVARKLSQQEIIQKELRKSLSSASPKIGQGGKIGIDEAWSALFAGESKTNKFLSQVKQAGGDPEEARQIVSIFNDLRGNPAKRLAYRPPKDDPTFTTYANALNFTQKIVNNLTGDQYRKALLKLTLDPNWASTVKEIISRGSKIEQQAGLASALWQSAQGVSILSATRAATAGLTNNNK